MVNASRSVLYASRGADWQDAARREAERLRDAIKPLAARRGRRALSRVTEHRKQ